jgi:hypothetical protein
VGKEIFTVAEFGLSARAEVTGRRRRRRRTFQLYRKVKYLYHPSFS